MKAMKSLTKKAQTMAVLLGVTGALLSSIPLQAEAGQRTLIKSHGVTVKACRLGARTLKLSGFHAGPAKSGFLSGGVQVSSSSFRTTHLSQGRRVGNWTGGVVYLNSKYVWVSSGRVKYARVSFTKGFKSGKRTVYVNFSPSVGSFSVQGLPKC